MIPLKKDFPIGIIPIKDSETGIINGLVLFQKKTGNCIQKHRDQVSF